uniref:Myb/SANT-like domain-containing protein n=1 Tax=Cannabis sativa TaxID=3483 RepID=A0A803NQW5_CANSA
MVRDHSTLSDKVLKIISSLSYFLGATIRFIPRSFNVLVHNFAQQVLRTDEEEKKYQRTTIEDSKLVECLLELVNSGRWKADNGTFKPGYLQQLERWMNEKVPHCRLKGQPHIESRIKILKKQFNAISDMLKQASGFGWNEDLKVIQNARGLRSKTFPHYDDFVAIFGKDRANRQDDLVGNPTDSHTSTGTTLALSRKRSRKRSRKLVEVLTTTVNKFSEIQAAGGDSIRRIVDCFQFETEGASRRLKVFDELKKIDGLSFEQRIEAGKLLVQNQAYTDLLFTLDDEYKLAFVLGLFK